MVTELNKKELETLRVIRNYLMHKGYFPSMDELKNELKYKSKRSPFLLIHQLMEKKVLKKKHDGSYQLMEMGEDKNSREQTVEVPLLGDIACGLPILALENINAMYPVSIKLARPPHKYFLLRAVGESMNLKGINDGDLVLVKQQSTAKEGDTVVALIDDSATIKEYVKGTGSVLLMPRSTDKNIKPIVLTQDFKVQGVVITSIPKID